MPKVDIINIKGAKNAEESNNNPIE